VKCRAWYLKKLLPVALTGEIMLHVEVKEERSSAMSEMHLFPEFRLSLASRTLLNSDLWALLSRQPHPSVKLRLQTGLAPAGKWASVQLGCSSSCKMPLVSLTVTFIGQETTVSKFLTSRYILETCKELCNEC
jgi:hypothetical protein